MVTNFVTGILPNSVRVSGNIYAIRSDFRIWMRFSEIMDSSDSEGRKIIQMLQACYPKIPEDLPCAIEQMIWFYRCGEVEEQEEEKKERYQRRTSKEPAFSFSQDAPYIYAAFKEQYGIDLTGDTELHWWKFMALFEALNEETMIRKVMYYRKASTSGVSKERRAFLNEMKKLYRIRGTSVKRMTLEERDKQWKDYVKNRRGAR